MKETEEMAEMEETEEMEEIEEMRKNTSTFFFANLTKRSDPYPQTDENVIFFRASQKAQPQTDENGVNEKAPLRLSASASNFPSNGLDFVLRCSRASCLIPPIH